MFLIGPILTFFKNILLGKDLKERHAFELRVLEEKIVVLHSERERLIGEGAKLRAQLDTLRTKLSEATTEKEKAQRELEALNRPPSILSAGEEAILKEFTHDSWSDGVKALQILACCPARRLKLIDVEVFIEKMRSHGFVVQARANAGQGMEYRLTPKGRRYANDYFTHHSPMQ